MDDPLARIVTEPVGVLGTVGRDGRPHLVPVVFAVSDGRVVTAVDWKPKSGRRLRRLTNLEADPRATLLVHNWSEDWGELWWVRVDGTAEIHTGGVVWDTAVAALVDKYPQYREHSPDGDAIVIEPTRISAWPDNR